LTDFQNSFFENRLRFEKVGPIGKSLVASFWGHGVFGSFVIQLSRNYCVRDNILQCSIMR